ncbi:MAG: hypothetical protein KY459_00950 [Acidobacteria bacterium]|nr:hypothetical protein [Acidobacteriota bacterium]
MDRGRAITAGLAGLTVALLSFRPTRNYDYFWHLATGSWIVDRGALPAIDPFTLASLKEEWINLEWLFDVIAYAVWSVAGHEGLTIVMAIGTGATAGIVAWLASRRLAPEAVLATIGISWAGLLFRLDVRPETASVPLFLLALWLALQAPLGRRTFLLVGTVIVWINVHPSALLAPVLVAAVWGGELAGRGTGSSHRMRAIQLGASFLALLANPWGWRGILAPIELAGGLEKAAGFVNLEWRASHPATFPLFWIVVLVLVAGWVLSSDRDLRKLAVTVLLTVLAARYARNQIYFFAALPLLITIPDRVERRAGRWLVAAAGIAAVVAVIAASFSRAWGTGFEHEAFPVHTASIVSSNRLEGAIYNPDQLGGYLIWTFYPERRVLTDGRNELHMDYIVALRDALRDSRRWNALMEQWSPAIAFEEYREPVEVLDAASGMSRKLPASLAFFPRSEWALVGFDDAAMLFLRRGQHDHQLIERLEYEVLVPDSPTGLPPGGADVRVVRDELERAWDRGDTSRVTREMARKPESR